MIVSRALYKSLTMLFDRALAEPDDPNGFVARLERPRLVFQSGTDLGLNRLGFGAKGGIRIEYK